MKITLSKIRRIIKEEIARDPEETHTADVYISPSLDRCKSMEDIVVDFCNYTADSLEIDREKVNIDIVDNREESGIRTTAYYNPKDHKIAIYGKNRAVVDICRSIAHELTHMQQMLNGKISFPVQDVGGYIEDEANAKAGELIKAFAQSGDDRSRIYESKSKSV